MRNKHLTRDQVLFIRAMYRVYYEVDEIAEHMGYSEKNRPGRHQLAHSQARHRYAVQAFADAG